MTNLVHIAVSELPLTAGEEQKAICGTPIQKAQWIWTAENGGSAIKEIFTRLTICADCWRCEWDGHYVYGVVRGGEHR